MTALRRYAALVLFCSLLAAPAAAQEETDPEAAAEAGTEAAEDWLALVDAGRYDESYEASSVILKEQVTAEAWRQTMSNLQAQLATLEPGGADSLMMPYREFVSAEYTTQLPNAPEGEYVVVQYRRVVGEQPLTELVFLTREDDAWRVAGYLARPEEGAGGQ